MHMYLLGFENYEEAVSIGNDQYGFQKVEISPTDWYCALDPTCALQNLSWKKVQTNSVCPDCDKSEYSQLCIIM